MLVEPEHWRQSAATMLRSLRVSRSAFLKEIEVLVLSRKKNDAVMIGDEIKLVIVDIRGDKIRLGIEAPQHVPVHRQEVYDAIKRAVAPIVLMRDWGVDEFGDPVG